ncbi:MAG TPA: response regulator transcription factor [Candidatus Bathyarchaeia archaeon]|jgi:DNA-binding NarL/FixJ family response regulator|nr:response regulator transcription factor [Candidatus Bathyarchaeia archaeon]
MAIRVVIADDHQIVRQGFRALLEKEGFDVVGEAEDGNGAVALVKRYNPDLALLDIAMPNLNGIDAAREILRVSPETRTILLTMFSEDHRLLEALRAGVSGYLLKTRAVEDLVRAIKDVVRGGVYLSRGLSREVVDAYLARKPLGKIELSPRERQVLQLVAEGKTTKEVAGLLGVSVKTAESHRGRIMAKLDIHETAGLVRYAIREGIIQA